MFSDSSNMRKNAIEWKSKPPTHAKHFTHSSQTEDFHGFSKMKWKITEGWAFYGYFALPVSYFHISRIFSRYVYVWRWAMWRPAQSIQSHLTGDGRLQLRSNPHRALNIICTFARTVWLGFGANMYVSNASALNAYTLGFFRRFHCQTSQHSVEPIRLGTPWRSLTLNTEIILFL